MFLPPPSSISENGPSLTARLDPNIQRLLEVEDVVSVAKPDERSITTYVAQYFHAFSTMGEREIVLFFFFFLFRVR
jgi:hypothetical protein